MSLSRRDFLRLVGLSAATTVGVSVLPRGLPVTAETQPMTMPPLRGRVLYPAQIVSSGNHQTVVRTVWEDEIIPIRPAPNAHWLLTQDGLIAADAVHPLPADYPSAEEEQPLLPYNAEVCAGIASVYAWCSVAAPLLTRVGGGGAAWVVDRLVIDGITWLGIATGRHSSVIGWTPGLLWRRMPHQNRHSIDRLVIDQAGRTLAAYRQGRLTMRAKTATSTQIPGGSYEVKYAAVCASEYCQIGHLSYPLGLLIPYLIGIGPVNVAGAYWHNRFGRPAADLVPEGYITVHPYVARALYASVEVGTPVMVI